MAPLVGLAIAVASHTIHSNMTPPTLPRHLGLLHATALNVALIVGAGVFVAIPQMLLVLPGPYAILGWLAGGVLMIADGLVWSELGAMMPGSGGTYRYLLEAYGPKRWGRLMAFLFVWQFLLSGPLEIASGLIAIALFSTALTPEPPAAWDPPARARPARIGKLRRPPDDRTAGRLPAAPRGRTRS